MDKLFKCAISCAKFLGVMACFVYAFAAPSALLVNVSPLLAGVLAISGLLVCGSKSIYDDEAYSAYRAMKFAFIKGFLITLWMFALVAFFDTPIFVGQVAILLVSLGCTMYLLRHLKSDKHNKQLRTGVKNAFTKFHGYVTFACNYCSETDAIHYVNRSMRYIGYIAVMASLFSFLSLSFSVVLLLAFVPFVSYFVLLIARDHYKIKCDKALHVSLNTLFFMVATFPSLGDSHIAFSIVAAIFVAAILTFVDAIAGDGVIPADKYASAGECGLPIVTSSAPMPRCKTPKSE